MELKLSWLWTPAVALLACGIIPVPLSFAQEIAKQTSGADTAEISLRKSIGVRSYKGHNIEGDEREVRVGDTLWHILVREKGLAGERFQEYFVLIRGLNPQLQTPESLRAGDKIFIPLRPNEVLALQAASQTRAGAERAPTERGKAHDYTVKSGEHLYQILRSQLGIVDERKLWQYFALVKDLNPQKNNWDILEKGETIRLPAGGTAQIEVQTRVAMIPLAQPQPAATAIGLDYARRLSAREHFALIGKVAESLGSEVQRSGEEVVTLKDGTIRLDKSAFPVVYNRALGQRVILDGENNIPESLRANLKQQSVNTPVVSVAQNTTLQEAVGQLLARLGYQPLPADRPVIIHEAGVSFEAKGQWVVTAPEQSNKPQEIVVINLADGTGEIPEYLKTHLGTKGLHLKNIALAQPPARDASAVKQNPPASPRQVKELPSDKSELFDALLQAYQVPFSVKDTLAVELNDGLRAEVTADRTVEIRGRKTAIFLRRIDPAIKAALEAKQGIKAIEVDIAALKSREIISALLSELGEKAAYKEHRFSAAHGSLEDRLVMTTAGFLLPDRSLFVTDREIPPRYQRVFFEKGLDIVYFQ